MGQPRPHRIRQFLDGVEYPCGRVELVRYAAANGAGEDLLGQLGCLPEDKRFDSFDGVHDALNDVARVEKGEYS